MVSQATIYTRQGCCLCVQAKQVLEEHGIMPEMIDIDLRPDLLDRYSDCIPVVLLDGVERFRGRIDPVLLRRFLSPGDGGDGGHE